MKKFIARRLLETIPLVIIISMIVFVLIHALPYDAIDTIITPDMSAETVEALKQQFGLDQPLHIQYFLWIKGVLSGNLGMSIITRQPIAGVFFEKVWNSMILIIPAYITAFVLALIFGLSAGSDRGSKKDKIIDSIFSIFDATPTYWFALIVIYVLGYQLDLFPIFGMHTIGQESSILDFLKHFFMPYLVLTVAMFPNLGRYVRSSTITEMSEDYVTVQKAYGNSKAKILLMHVSKNVLLPMVTQLGLALPLLVTGSMITETIFGWPGIGPYFFNATKSLDYPIVMVVLLFSSALVILGSLLSDILYSVVDPRIKKAGEKS